MATEKKAPAAEKELNMVTMQDGTIVEFSGKRKMLKSSIVDEKGIGVRLDFANGQTRTFYIPAEMIEKFAVHGAEQKLGDEIAGVDDIEDCVMAVDDLIDRLYGLEWSAKREANSLAGASVLAKALVEVGGKTLDEVRAFLSTKTQAEKVALRANAKVAPIVARLEAAKQAKKKPGKEVDTDSLLNDLALGNVGGAAAIPTSTGAATTEGTAEAAE